MIGRFAGTVSSRGPSSRFEHLAVGQLGKQPIHRLIQPQLAFFHQDHRRGGRDRLADRRDAKNRIAAHRVLAAQGLHANRINMHLAAPADQRDQSGNVAVLDMAGHHVVHAVEPRL